MAGWALAGFWGLVAGSALVLGAAIGYWTSLPQRLIAGIMAFGAGVLISALSFDLMDEAYRVGGFAVTGAGFLAGAGVFTAANLLLARFGARQRKRSGNQQPSQADPGTGLAIALGALLDGIPESVVIGVSLIGGHRVSLVAVAAVFLSNVPEGLSSSAGMKRAGRSRWYVFGIWGAIAMASGVAALLGYVVFRDLGSGVVAGTTAVAAGAILAMLADTMIPEAVEQTHGATGLITAFGFLAAFFLSKMAGP